MAILAVVPVAAALLVAVANAQSAPAWDLIPKACATDCAATIQSSYLCSQQYSSGTAAYGCFCEAFPSDATACASCLTTNDAASLGSLLTSTVTDCPKQVKSCAFACAFETCESTDVACQCNAVYLENIYNCASCNTANGNTGTLIADFTALNSSCANQNYTGPDQAFSTYVQAPSTAGYQAPVLTATGGGEAASGTFAAATAKVAATEAAGGASSAAAAQSTGAAVAASGSQAASGSAAAAATTSAKSSAGLLTVPVGVVAFVAAAAALL